MLYFLTPATMPMLRRVKVVSMAQPCVVKKQRKKFQHEVNTTEDTLYPNH